MANVYDNIINGSFNALNPSVAEMYAGIYPPASSTPTPSYQSGMLGRGMPAPTNSPYMTAAEQQLLQRQIQQSQALQAGYYPDGSPKPMAPPVGIPSAPASVATPASWNSIDSAGYNARKPGTWGAQSRQQAQALMRQMALRNAGVPGGAKQPNGPPVAAAMLPKKSAGLFDLLFGGAAGAQGGSGSGLAALLNQKAPQPYGGRYTPQELADRTAQGIAIGNANRASPTPTHDVAGNNNAFMSTNHQNSVRWQTGY